MPRKPEDVVVTFGRHQGKTLGDVLAEDPAYLDWLAGFQIHNAVLREAVREMNEKYAAEIDGAIGED